MGLAGSFWSAAAQLPLWNMVFGETCHAQLQLRLPSSGLAGVQLAGQGHAPRKAIAARSHSKASGARPRSCRFGTWFWVQSLLSAEPPQPPPTTMMFPKVNTTQSSRVVGCRRRLPAAGYNRLERRYSSAVERAKFPCKSPVRPR